MPTVLEEITETEITPQHVEQRVNDWGQRIDELYSQIEGWLPAGYSTERRRTVLMNEEMMKKFGIPSRTLPVLEIRCGDFYVAKFEPRALWIVGANGQLDVAIGKNQYIIVDIAKNFDTPSWILSPFSKRRNREPLTQETFRSILSA